MNKGMINQIIGPVIDIKFDAEHMPELLNSIVIHFQGRNIVAEVAQHVGDDVARCVALSSTEGLTRGMEAEDTGEPIHVPVGREVLGRLFNVIGETIDEKGPLETLEKASKTDARLVNTARISASPDKILACKSSGPETTSYSVSELSNCVFSYTSFERAAAGAPAGNTTC